MYRRGSRKSDPGRGGSSTPRKACDVKGILTVSDFDSKGSRARRSSRAADLAAAPDAARWARDCAWVPGSGHCRNRPCNNVGPFREQRETEASRIEHARRQRRRDQRAFAEGIIRLTSN
jgi:hypothetical protein